MFVYLCKYAILTLYICAYYERMHAAGYHIKAFVRRGKTHFIFYNNRYHIDNRLCFHIDTVLVFVLHILRQQIDTKWYIFLKIWKECVHF